VAAITFLLRRWPSTAILVGLLAVVILLATVAGLDPGAAGEVVGDGLIDGNSWNFFGRSLVLTEQIQTVLLLFYGGLGLLFILAFIFPQDSVFVPFSFGLAGLGAAVLMVQPFVFGALILILVSGAVAVLIQGDRAGSTLAAWRVFAIFTLAVPLLLVSGWMLESGQLQYMPTASRLIMIALVLMLAGFPFHIWVAPAIVESQSLVPAVVFGLVQLIIVIFFVDLLLDNLAVWRNAQLLHLVRISGAATVIMAGILALTSRSFARLLGYLLLLNIGVTLWSLTSISSGSLETTYTLVLLRTVSLALAGAGLGLIRRQIDPQHEGVDRLGASRGLARKTPLGVALFVYGALSLAGLPLTPGFNGQWAAVNLAGNESPLLAAVLILSMVIAATGLLRWVPLTIRQIEDGNQRPADETTVERIVAGLLLAAGIILAIYPSILLDIANRLATLS
jgi:formate hydrogenlyase subunit 3/multisubunit Na+/H+ antiporter MnhD subunit